MRKVVFVACVAWVTATWAQSGNEAKPETLLRWSFAGTKRLSATKELKTFNELTALPEAIALRDAAAQNLARRAAGRFTSGGNTNNHAEIALLIQPLIPDLIQNESQFQLDTRGAQDADWRLAVKLTSKRSQEWGKSLAQLAKLSGMQGASAENSKWVASRDKYKMSFFRSGDWTILEGGFGEPDAKTSKDFRGTLGKRKGKLVLDAEVNAPLLAKIWSAPQLARFPKLALQAEPKRDGFHSELLLEYPQDLEIKAEKWNVPTEIIRDPLIGFTAIQGIRKHLAGFDRFKAVGAKETPNQLFMWAQNFSPFSITVAGDVKNPAEVVANAERAFKDLPLPSGALQRPTNRNALVWTGLPIVIPFIEPAPAPRESFLMGGLFPIEKLSPTPAPPELFEELNQRNLVYYDWEITGDRLEQWIPLWQLYYLLGNKVGPESSAPSARLLKELQFRIGNTVTAGTLENQRHIKFVRQSHLGVNALELVLLAHWLDAADLRPMAPRSDGQKQVVVPPVAP